MIDSILLKSQERKPYNKRKQDNQWNWNHQDNLKALKWSPVYVKKQNKCKKYSKYFAGQKCVKIINLSQQEWIGRYNQFWIKTGQKLILEHILNILIKTGRTEQMISWN